MEDMSDRLGLGSKLGFGTLRLPKDREGKVDTQLVNELVDRFIALGGQYFEAAYVYAQSEETIRKCLVERYPRESYLLADKMPIVHVRRTADYESYFQEQLTRCGVDHFDFYLLHNIGYRAYLTTEKLGGFEFLRQLKQQGLAHRVGFSFHDSAEVLEEILAKYHEYVDLVQLQINYLDWESPVIQSRKCYDVARRYDLPVFVMEPNKGGRLITLPEEAAAVMKAFDPSVSPAQWAMRWVSSLDQVACVLSGMRTAEQIAENMQAVRQPSALTDAEQDMLRSVVGKVNEKRLIQCTACRYCVPVCPKNIPIPELLNLKGSDNPGHVGRMYERITDNKGRAQDCIRCGRCEQACSQHLEIRKYMAEIAQEYARKSKLKRYVRRALKKLRAMLPGS